jgi:hypothetical protein
MNFSYSHWFIVYHFSSYTTIVQLYDGGHFLLVEERTQIHYTMYLRERSPTFRKLTDKLSHTVTSVRAGFEPTLEARGVVIWDQCLNHSATDAPSLWYNINVLTTRPRRPLHFGIKMYIVSEKYHNLSGFMKSSTMLAWTFAASVLLCI